MSSMGRSSGDDCSNSPSPWDCTSSPQSIGGPRAADTCGGSSGSPRCVRIFRIGSGSVMKLISRISPPQLGHASGNASPTRDSSLAQAIRDVSWWQGFVSMVPGTVESQNQQPNELGSVSVRQDRHDCGQGGAGGDDDGDLGSQDRRDREPGTAYLRHRHELGAS